jgi:hypothetical protein
MEVFLTFLSVFYLYTTYISDEQKFFILAKSNLKVFFFSLFSFWIIWEYFSLLGCMFIVLFPIQGYNLHAINLFTFKVGVTLFFH